VKENEVLFSKPGGKLSQACRYGDHAPGKSTKFLNKLPECGHVDEMTRKDVNLPISTLISRFENSLGDISYIHKVIRAINQKADIFFSQECTKTPNSEPL